jgi:zinc/manganese transport system substrate-binding protein
MGGLLLGSQWEDAYGADHKLRVVTSFLPVYCFTVNVTGDLAEVNNLLQSGVDPHDFQFSPREMKKLAAADMVVVNGLQLEPWLDKVAQFSEKPKLIVEAAAGLKSELIMGVTELDTQNGNRTSSEEAGLPNPHIWLDPKLAAHAVTNILQALQKADPANAAGYARNAARYLERLEKLDQELHAGLMPLKGEAMVTFHDAFPYFARRYELKIVGVIEKVADVQPSPKYLTALGRVIQRDKVKVIFTDRQYSSRLAEQLGRDYHVPVAELDTLETGDFKPESYEAGMKNNLRVLEKWLK